MEWVSVKDNLPPRLQSVLVLTIEGARYVASQCDWDDVCDNWHYMPQSYDQHQAEFKEVTHWMTLPELPK